MNAGKLITTVDAHVWGQAVRIITAGMLPLRGATIKDKAADFAARYGPMGRLLMLEPRGHADMTGCVIVAADDEEADFGLLFLHNEGMADTSGTGIIAAVTAALETGALSGGGGEKRLIVDTPAGRVAAAAKFGGAEVTYRQVPCYPVRRAVPIRASGCPCKTDIAFAGELHAVVPAAAFDLRVRVADRPALSRAGKAVRKALSEAGIGVSAITLIDPDSAGDGRSFGRQATIFADGQLDRSAGPNGACARAALLHADGKLAVGDSFVCENLAGEPLIGRLAGEMNQAVVPEITGRAYITGIHQFYVDPADPFPQGFRLQ